MPELRTLHEFNNALSGDDAPYDLALKDGCATRGLQIPKSNWGGA